MASHVGVSHSVIGQSVDVISVSGNERSQEKYVLEWSGLAVGQILTVERLSQAQQGLRDTGLFEQISFHSERREDGSLELHITLKEKHSWLLLPRLSRNGDGDIKAGLRLRVYNIQGADQTFEMLAQHEDESDGDDSEEVRLRYKWPLYNSPYELSWKLRQKIENTEIDDFDNVETGSSVSMKVSRDFPLESQTSPLTIASAIKFAQRELDEPYPDSIEARESGKFNNLSIAFIFDDVHSEKFRRYGQYYELYLERGFDWLDSDYESEKVTFAMVRFLRLNRHDNINFRFVTEISNNSPYNYLRYDIGGYSNLRGLESVDDRGDARIFGNLEYIIGFRKHPNFRSTVFVDVGNVYEDFEEIDLSDVHYTVGIGLRWKIQSFVRTDLFIDYGYDAEDENGKIYGGTSLAF
jgi:outer membrane protein assembly factor BamA